jgi:putative membrane protein
MRALRQSGAVFAITLAAAPAFAHEAGGASAASRWSFEPAVIIPLALSAALFAAGAARRWKRPGWSSAQVCCFAGGWLTLFVALVTPVHALGSVLFSVHMTQHELLMIVAAPLLVLSRPIVWFLWALPQAWRESAGAWAKQPTIAALWSAMTVPLFVWLLHGATLWAWHIPSLYDASVDIEWVHAVQHTMFLATALLFWWTLIHGRHGRLSYGAGVIYCFTTAVHTSALGALMTFAQQVWYPIYQGRTAPFHLTPLEDQQIGGLIMWVPAGIVFIALGLWLMAAFLRDAERRVAYTRAEQLAAGGRGA